MGRPLGLSLRSGTKTGCSVGQTGSGSRASRAGGNKAFHGGLNGDPNQTSAIRLGPKPDSTGPKRCLLSVGFQVASLVNGFSESAQALNVAGDPSQPHEKPSTFHVPSDSGSLRHTSTYIHNAHGVHPGTRRFTAGKRYTETARVWINIMPVFAGQLLIPETTRKNSIFDSYFG